MNASLLFESPFRELLLTGLILAVILLIARARRLRRERDEALAELSRERALFEERVAERTKALAESEERFRKLFENAGDAIFLGDLDGRFIDVNRAAERQTGYSREELLRMGAADLDVERPQEAIKNFHETFDEDAPQVFEAVNRCKDGRLIHLEVKGVRLPWTSDNVVLMGITRDITRRKQLEDELRDFAFRDSLTGLPNRRLLLDRLGHALLAGRRQGCLLAVLFIDLDGLKVLNDTRGHEAGDMLLVETARRLMRAVRDSDTVARLGGDEFVVLLEGLDGSSGQAEDHVASVVGKIREMLGGEMDLGGEGYVGSASIGVRICRENDIDPELILREADAAMYEDKRRAGNPA